MKKVKRHFIFANEKPSALRMLLKMKNKCDAETDGIFIVELLSNEKKQIEEENNYNIKRMLLFYVRCLR